MSQDPLERALAAIRALRAKVTALERARSEPIAIVGMGCRFPGGVDGPDAFWQLLCDGVDAIREVPPSRWPIDEYYDPDSDAPGKMYSRCGGFLEDIELFDAAFFEISPREALRMDPQQRLLLETCWEALEHAGQAPDTLEESRTGVFVGISNSDYGDRLRRTDPREFDAYYLTGNALNFAAGRISYFLGLQGPAMAIDTACSSSLVSVHLACQSLRCGECDMALAGGVNVALSPDWSVIVSRARMLSPDGRCKSFDASADGFVRGEGSGIVVLKRLADALANGDNILALVRGSAVNHDGPSSGITVPSGPAQEALIREALARAGIDPGAVGYVEAHGTGTSLGDPIEIQAIGNVLGRGRTPENRLVVGTAKTNVGHLESAAGVAGLIKTILAMQHGEIPRHLHLNTVNPHISLEQSGIVVPRGHTAWPSDNSPRIAGVSSFGASGTNAHMIVEQAPPVERLDDPGERRWQLLCLSGKNDSALQGLASRFGRHLSVNTDQSLNDVCFTANTGRSHFAHRLASVAESAADMAESLLASPRGHGAASDVISGKANSNKEPRVVFLFSGQGAQYVGMGRGLFESEPVFRDVLQRCDEVLRDHLEQPLLDVLYSENESASPLNQTEYTQPVLFAFEYALAKLWESWGVRPSAVLGHSIGEYVAACVAGVFTMEDGLKLVAARGRMMQALPERGAMAAVFADESSVGSALAEHSDLSIAAVNGPRNVVISGRQKALEQCLADLSERGIRSTRLNVSHAFHSSLMEPMLDGFESVASDVTFEDPRIRIVSNETGDWLDQTPSSAYLRRHVRRPVRFADSMSTLDQRGYDLFLEIGPGTTLVGMGRQCLTSEGVTWLLSLRRGQPDARQMLKSLGELYVRGLTPDWAGNKRYTAGRRVVLPTYPFQRQRYWTEPSDSNFERPRSRSPENVDWQDWLYEIQWCDRALPVAGAPDLDADSPKRWLVLADSRGIGDELVRLLRAQGMQCVVVYAGSRYERMDDRTFTIAADSLAELGSVLKALESEGRASDRVAHLWSLDARGVEDESSASIEAGIERCCGSVLRLVRSLAQCGSTPRSLWLVTSGAQPAGAPARLSIDQSPLWGLGRVISLEMPEVRTGLVDLDRAASATESARSLFMELLHAGRGEQVAHRGTQRLVARYVRRRPAAEANPAVEVRDNGTFLITGGLGALGIKIARWLIDRGARHLVLVGRRGGGEDTQDRLAALRARGAEVLVERCDVSDWEQVSRLLTRLKSSSTPLKGIIHAAGVVERTNVLDLEWDGFSRVLAPKVSGAWNLHQSTLDSDLDFFVLFSSVSSTWGSRGLGHYAAANQFLDALAHYRRSAGLTAAVVNWGLWADGPRAADQDPGALGELQRLFAKTGMRMMNAGDALEALGQLLAEGAIQATVADVDWSVFKPLYEAQGAQLLQEIEISESTAGEAPQRGALVLQVLQTPAARRKELLFAHVESELVRTLGLDPATAIDREAGFFEMGIDSLMSVELRNRLESSLGVPLPVTLLFDYPTVENLIDYLLGEIVGVTPEIRVEGEGIPGEPKDLEQASDVEVASLLDDELDSLEHSDGPDLKAIREN